MVIIDIHKPLFQWSWGGCFINSSIFKSSSIYTKIMGWMFTNSTILNINLFSNVIHCHQSSSMVIHGHQKFVLLIFIISFPMVLMLVIISNKILNVLSLSSIVIHCHLFSYIDIQMSSYIY